MEHGLQLLTSGGKGSVPLKQLFGAYLTLRDYDAQVVEAMSMFCALNKMTRLGMQKVSVLPSISSISESFFSIRFIQK